MKRSNILLLLVALFGLVAGGFLLVRAIRFFHFVNEINKNNPELNYRDTISLPVRSDTLNTLIATLNQQIAEALQKNKAAEKEQKQVILYRVINEFFLAIDSIEKANMDRDETVMNLKTLINKTNLGSRAGLFDIHDADHIPALASFMLLDLKKLNGTPFECLEQSVVSMDCFEKIKQEVLLLQSQILQANLLHLKTVP